MLHNILDTTTIQKLVIPVSPKVLLVDDDELVLARLQELVAAAGYEVITAANGRDALASLKSTFTPIVITDLNMKGMDGLTLCRSIRDQEWPGYVYLIVLTVQGNEDRIVAGLEAGADDYLCKRMSSAQLLARLRTAQRILTVEQSLKASLEEKRRLALTDALTGVANRRYFMKHLNRELKRVHRFGGDLSLLLVDIDNFKQVNDRYGHSVGDAVLKEVVMHVSKCLKRETDWCARLGGDELAVVLEGTGLTGARIFAERLRKLVADATISTSGGSVRLTVSIGVSGPEASLDRGMVTVQSLLNQADQHLYLCKERGRNRVSSPEPLRGSVNYGTPVKERAAGGSLRT